ncbi:F-box/LRR-repeat protein At3g58900-like isoform X2 [Telopea speciosissima]|uniref:F-box/LRR-repeat protein At3g58900-like isoform X2 n=1 Tax=Telopea speciosissima TaxID=54955 RepID=UPI001CC5C25F|nr:F-box/LRR-repeat protein At3g58900-like isoform X2 [Telopea speciosissima]
MEFISDLPDSILSHILSFLPTKDAMKTSFLSKRWESLWTSVPLIDLDERLFIRRRLELKHNLYGVNFQEQKKFADFVERFIAFHGSLNVQELRLRFDIGRYLKFSSRAERWVRTVMTSDAKIIDIDFSGKTLDWSDLDKNMYILPPCGFPSRSLTILRLRFCEFIYLQNTSFVSLQTLVLTAVKVSNSSVNALICSSPCLEKLHLECCYVPVYFLVEAPVSHLKCMVVNNCVTPGRKFIEHFSLSIPSLQSFKFKGIINDFSVKNLWNLIEVEIEEQNVYNGFQNHEYRMVCKLFNELRHVQFLTLTNWFLEVLGNEQLADNILLIDDLNNLKHLKLKMWLADVELQGLATLLRLSPNLETLSINIGEPGDTDASDMLVMSILKEHTFWEELTMPFYFLLHLKKVEIKGFEGRGNEIEFGKYLLKNSEVLEKMVISNADLTARYGKYTNKRYKKTLEKLQQSSQNFLFLPKASPEIILS